MNFVTELRVKKFLVGNEFCNRIEGQEIFSRE